MELSTFGRLFLSWLHTSDPTRAEEITIVLCRHIVGADRDYIDLENLRYQVQRAEAEYEKRNQLSSRKNPEPNDLATTNDHVPETDDNEMETEENIRGKKRKCASTNGEDLNDSERTRDRAEPAAKKKKVSFAPPAGMTASEASSTLEEGETNPGTTILMSDDLTLAALENLRKDLQEAERLESLAWELRQRLFGSRVVSRTDVGDLGRDVKSLKRIFPCGGTMAAVVDDREDVWANADDNSDDTIKGEPPDNLLLVRPYHWQPFLGFADVNNAAGVDLSGVTAQSTSADPSNETDVQLLWTGNLLKKLHERYYAQAETVNRETVPDVLKRIRREVLQGCKLVLSGLVPLHKKNIGVNSPRPPIVRYAESLGARVRYYIHWHTLCLPACSRYLTAFSCSCLIRCNRG